MGKTLKFFTSVALLLTIYLDANIFPWSAPTTIGTNYSDVPDVAVDPQGNAVAVWRFHNDLTAENLVQAATFNFQTQQWSPTKTISTNTFNLGSPLVVVDTAGNAVAIWSQSTFIQAAYLPFGSTDWTSPIQISGNALFFTTGDLVINASGTIFAIWNETTNVSHNIQAVMLPATLPFGQNTWTSPVTIATVGLQSEVPSIGIADSGNAVAVFGNGGSPDIIFASTFSGGTWSTPVAISNPLFTSGEPHVVVDPAGNATAIWRTTNGTNFILDAATLAAGSTTWTSPVTVSSTSESTFQGSPFAIVDPKGTVTAAWTVLGTGALKTATLPLGGSWTAPITVPTGGVQALVPYNGAPILAVSAIGDLVITWVERLANNTFEIETSTKLAGSNSWSPFQTLSDQTAYASRGVAAALSPFGSGVITWSISLDVDDTIAIVQAVTNKGVFAPLPASNLTGQRKKTEFLTQTEFADQLRWNASSDPFVVSYKIRRNGKLIKTFAADSCTSFKFTLHNVGEHQKNKYQVTAVNGNGLESDPLTITIK